MGVLKNKKGQVTIFIIVALVIVVLGVLIFLFYPKLKISSGFDAENPNAFLQDCVEDDLQDLVKTLSEQGISLSPQNYVFYEKQKLQYLCYTNEYEKPCVRSPPFLVDEFQNQISENIKFTIEQCFVKLSSSYNSKGYSTELKNSLGKLNSKILPGKIDLELSDYEFTVSKSSSEKYVSFNILLDSNLYELLEVASDILEDEIRFGQADKTSYMLKYINLKITGPEYTDGTNIYVIQDKKTKEMFQFASRSFVPKPII